VLASQQLDLGGSVLQSYSMKVNIFNAEEIPAGLLQGRNPSPSMGWCGAAPGTRCRCCGGGGTRRTRSAVRGATVGYASSCRWILPPESVVQ